MPSSASALVILFVLMAVLVAILLFSVLRLAAGLRRASRRRHEGDEASLMAAAVQEAVATLRAQEQAMRFRAEASERLASEIIAGMTSGLLVVGGRGEVRTLNPAGRRLLGIGERMPLADEYRVLLAAAAPLADAIDECLAEGRPIVRRTLEIREAGAAGSGASHLGVTVSPIFGDGQAAQGVICLFTDLTAVMELEEQLRLREGLAQLGELTAGIAHEFRNGLATIHGYSRLMDPEKLPGAYRAYLEAIRQETESLRQIVTNFLNFARPAQLSLAPVALETLVARAADELRAEAESRGGSVVVRGRFATVDGDEVLLRQALSNLCRNALEACVDAGRAPHIVIEGATDGAARIAVSDNGPGVGAEVRDRIFRPFFTTRAKGTGLGLALVQKIVVTHNGRVHVENLPDGGARFSIVLPLDRTASPPA